MPYRDAAPGPEEETLETYDVSITKGGELIGIRLGFSTIFAVAYVVSLIDEPPLEIQPWVRTFPVCFGVLVAPAIWLWIRRKRKMLLVRVGDKVKLVVRGEVEVAFPLTLTGSQMTTSARGIPSYTVFMKAVDAEGRAIFFKETRGAVHGAQPDWFVAIDRTTQAKGYDVGVGYCARLRARVEEINRKDPADVT